MATTTNMKNNSYHYLIEQQQQQHHDHQELQIHNNNNNNYGMMMQSSSNSSSTSIHGNNNFIGGANKDGGVSAATTTTTTTQGHAYDLGELDQALFLYLDGQSSHQDPNSSLVLHQDQKNNSGMRPPTLNIFPSQPMHIEPSSQSQSQSKLLVSSSLISPATTTTTSKPSMELTNSKNNNNINHLHHQQHATLSTAPPKNINIKREVNHRKGPTPGGSEQDHPKTPDPKTLRRLAQNREAARKSRLRKKAYVQQLESSRIRLSQIEQELQRARGQGIFFGGGDQGCIPGGMSSDAAVFDMEYARWLEENNRIVCELRAAVQEHLPENDLRLFANNSLAHYDELVNLKSMFAKTDVFHIVSGMWLSPAERCFMWLGGFRPSELIKIISSQIEPLTEQQLIGIYGLQQSTQEGEEALSQGLEALNQSVSDTIASDSLNFPPNMSNYMGHMVVAMNKLSTLEGFVRQADNLRQQTLHRLHQILTTRQAARCQLAFAEYFHRLRALSSLWLTRPRQE
ncbi:hypothetical protein ACFE04_002080 [Oxalis oulophora]